jgi:hypothetical protein
MRRRPSPCNKVFISSLIPLENIFDLRQELQLYKEDFLVQGEELQKYQRHCSSLADEVSLLAVMNLAPILQGIK